MHSILIIDNDKSHAIIIRELLKKDGYKVYYSDRIRPGFQKAVDKKPDLVLMELLFPEGDGLKLLRDLKSNTDLVNTHIMVVSQRNDDLDIVLALELGADDYVTKPASYREIAARIKSQFRYPKRVSEEQVH